MNQEKKLKLKKAKEELDKLLDEKGLGKLKDIERELIGIKKKIEDNKPIIEGNKPIDVREELNEIKKEVINEITRVKTYSGEKLAEIEKAVRELIKKPSKDYSKNIEGIISAVKGIEIYSLKRKLEDIEKRIEELIAKPTKDYTEEIQGIIEAVKEVKTYDQKENTEKIVRTIKDEFVKVKPKDYKFVLKQVVEQIERFRKEGKEVKNVKIINFPESETEGIIQTIFERLKSPVTAFITNREPEEAIPVVLTDRERKAFYTAMFQAMGGGISIDMSTIENSMRIPNEVGDGRRVVAAAGTRVRLVATSTLCKYVDIMAEVDNTSYIVVGGSTVIAALLTRRGIPLYAGQSIRIEISNLYDIWIDSMVNGEGVTFTYYN